MFRLDGIQRPELIQRALELEDALKILVLMEAHNKFSRCTPSPLSS